MNGTDVASARNQNISARLAEALRGKSETNPSLENIKLAHLKAKKGKSHYKEVQEFELNSEYYCSAIQAMLSSYGESTQPL